MAAAKSKSVEILRKSSGGLHHRHHGHLLPSIPDSLPLRRCNSMRLLLFLRIPSSNGNQFSDITVDTIMQYIGFVCSTEFANVSSAAVT